MFQVLEHLDGLDELFERLGTVTTHEAHLFIAVPNGQRVEFNELHGSLLDMPPNHVGRWNRASFEAIAHRHGWRIAAHEIERERLGGKLKQYAAYRYVYRRQDRRSLANRIERLRRTPLRRVAQAVIAGLYALGALPEMLALTRGADLGDSQWVHLVKTSR